MIKKVPSGRWQVDLRTDGRGSKRIRKSFDSKAEAKCFETYILTKSAEGKEWSPSKADNRRLKDLVQLWFDAKGVHLKDGERRKRCLDTMADFMGNPIARITKPAAFLA